MAEVSPLTVHVNTQSALCPYMYMPIIQCYTFRFEVTENLASLSSYNMSFRTKLQRTKYGKTQN